MDPTPTKKAYLPNFPFVTHTTVPNYVSTTDPVFNPEYNTWYWITPPHTNHPINNLQPGINPFRNLFAELIVTGQVFWDGHTYKFRDPNGFWHTCKKHNINPRFPPTPIFTAPTADSHCFKAIAEYYTLFGTYNQLTNLKPWVPFASPKPLRPLSTNFQFPLTTKPVSYARRRHYLECSDTSTSDEPTDIKPNKRYKRDDQSDL